MKTRMHATLVGIALTLATADVSSAKSHLAALAIEPQGVVTAGDTTIVKYGVTVTRTGQGLLEVTLSSRGLPAGAMVAFCPNRVRFTGRKPKTLTSTLTITYSSGLPLSPCTFTVTGQARCESRCATAQFPLEFPTVLSPLPVLTLDSMATEGANLRGIGTAGVTYQIEATADLAAPSWSQIGTTTADDNGHFTFLDTQAKDFLARFYRVLLLVPTGSIRCGKH
jgi:hypothetical protein